MSGDYHDIDDEPLFLGTEALEALQSVLGVDLDLTTLIKSRRENGLCNVEDDSNEHNLSEQINEDDETIRPGETHADYYKRLYPERYSATANTNQTAKGSQVTNPVAVVTVDDEYVKNIILNAFINDFPHWTVLDHLPTNQNEKYHLHFGEYEHIDWFSTSFHAEEVVVSCYYNRKGLIRKGHLAKILEKWQAKYKDRLPIAPKSYVLRLPLMSNLNEYCPAGNAHSSHDEESVMNEEFLFSVEQAVRDSGFPGFSPQNPECAETHVWILKPSVTNQAIGICLVDSMSQLRRALYNADPIQLAGDFVLQRYLPPLLLDGRKFHLRVFMILHGNLTAYVDPNFLAIFSLRKYIGASLQDTRAHLTNIAHQDVQSIEDHHRCMRLFEETKQDMIDSSLVSNMDEADDRVRGVRQRIYDMIAETVEAVSSELTFSSKSNCFEIYGLDFMLDDNWNTWLLEANAEPDLSKAGDRLQHVIDTMVLDTLSIVMENDNRFGHGGNGSKENGLVKVFERKGRSF